MSNNEPVSRRTRSKAPITPKSEREMRAQLRAEVSDRLQRSSNAGGQAKRRKKDNRSAQTQTNKAGQKKSSLSSVKNLQDIPHDVLARIFQFIAASDGNYLYSTKKVIEQEDSSRLSECAMKRNTDMENKRQSIKRLSLPESSPVISLHGIAGLMSPLSTTSKQMLGLVQSFIKISLVDIDLYGIPTELQLYCLLWAIRRKPKFSRIRADLDVSDTLLLAHVLINCDTSRLKACSVSAFISSGNICVQAAWLAKFGTELVIDLTTSEDTVFSTKTYNAMLLDLGIKRSENIQADMPKKELFEIIATECPSIEILSVDSSFDPYDATIDSTFYSFASSFVNLKYLDHISSFLRSWRREIRRSLQESLHLDMYRYCFFTKMQVGNLDLCFY